MFRKEDMRISGQIFNNTEYDKYVYIDGVDFHYREYPSKKKKAQHVVLLHGFASSTYTWDAIDYRLHEEGYHVWALDMKGFGWSDKPLDSDYHAITLMEEVNKWMVTMGLDDVIFVGHSYGGGLAALLAFSYPKRIKKLVLVDAPAYEQKLPMILRLLRLPLSQQITTLVGNNLLIKILVKIILREIYYHKKWVSKKQVFEYYQRLITPNAAHIQIFLSKAIDFGALSVYSERLSEIKHDTLLIWGENDPWIPLSTAYEFNKDLPNSKLVIIPECGHSPFEEKPEISFKMLLNFMKGKDVYTELKGTIKGESPQDLLVLNKQFAAG
ncbi:MAG: alpha/beta hydrolase [bacterium]|nr:alpha/beta hydrolase [bacterium]